MSNFIKILVTVLLLCVAAVCVLLFISSFCYEKGLKIDEELEKTALLEKASRIYPWNASVFHELGKVYFDLGLEKLGRDEDATLYLQKSTEFLKKSLQLNPADFLGHFNYAQALKYLNIYKGLDSSTGSGDQVIFEGYKKAAELAGHNSEIYFEVGKIMLAKWSSLSDIDQNYVINLLREIMNTRNKDWLQELLYVWEMNSRDYTLMDRVLPDDTLLLRQYVDFLGERSLAIEERLNVLAYIEYLDFMKAKREFRLGESDLRFLRTEDAIKRFQISRNILNNIRFVQNFQEEKLIDLEEYESLKVLSGLNLAKSRIEEGAEIQEVEQDLLIYIENENNIAEIENLLNYLQDKGIIQEKPEESFENLNKVVMHLYLYYRQNRYREIIRVGRILQDSIVVVPEDKKTEYLKVLLVVGDAYRKIDSFYNALEIYQKALEMEANNLETLIRLRQNFAWLNREEESLATGNLIDNLLSPNDLISSRTDIEKGKEFVRRLTFKGDGVRIKIELAGDEQESAPLIRVVFNQKLIYENYVEDRLPTLEVESLLGENILIIRSLNKKVSIENLSWESIEQALDLTR